MVKFSRGTNPKSIENLKWNKDRETPPEKRRNLKKSINISKEAENALSVLRGRGFKSNSMIFDMSLKLMLKMVENNPEMYKDFIKE